MIELKALARSFGEVKAVNGVDLYIPKGQICGYLGPNGAGKTTTIKMLTGMIKPTSGSALIDGFDIQADELPVKRRIGYVPESGAVYQSLTPFEYLRFIGNLHEIDDNLIPGKIAEFLNFFGMGDKKDERMDNFSKGMKQKIVISAALLHNPDVIFLDEPLNGLDANAALLLKNLVRNLADGGKTIFYSSHILEVVENLCDRVVIINEGEIIADGSVHDLKEMTKKSNLEDVFSQLTDSGNAAELARAFSGKMTESNKA